MAFLALSLNSDVNDGDGLNDDVLETNDDTH